MGIFLLPLLEGGYGEVAAFGESILATAKLGANQALCEPRFIVCYGTRFGIFNDLIAPCADHCAVTKIARDECAIQNLGERFAAIRVALFYTCLCGAIQFPK